MVTTVTMVYSPQGGGDLDDVDILDSFRETPISRFYLSPQMSTIDSAAPKTINVTLTLPARKRMTHAQSRERNERFAAIVREMLHDPQVASMKKSRLLSYLRAIIASEHGITVPLSAAYKVMATVDERFTPKHRTTD